MSDMSMTNNAFNEMMSSLDASNASAMQAITRANPAPAFRSAKPNKGIPMTKKLITGTAITIGVAYLCMAAYAILSGD